MKHPRLSRGAAVLIALLAPLAARPARALLVFTSLPENQAAIERTAEQWQAELLGLQATAAPEATNPGLLTGLSDGDAAEPGPTAYAGEATTFRGTLAARGLRAGRTSPLGWIPEPTPLALAFMGLLALAFPPVRRALARARR